jgi:type II secretory ATPase GspE/PulE/Tfp pilus assembly ATPase PilB-like protein
MVSSSDTPLEPKSSSPSDKQSDTARLKSDWMSQVDTEQAFRLVDSILPFEACLYHQILPLSLEGSRLKLGMVDIDDTTALDYVRRILAYMNCSLVPQSLASDVHYAALSAYLSYADTQKKAVSVSPQPVARRIAKKLAEQSAKRFADSKSVENSENTTSEEVPPKAAYEYPTLVVDSPATLPAVVVKTEVEMQTTIDSTQVVAEISGTSVQKTSTAPLPTQTLPRLEIYPTHLSDPLEVLATLAPKVLLQELLARILDWGIGRLYLERQSQRGKILWSQNGAVQAVLEGLELSRFDGVIRELKVLTEAPMEPVQKTRQIEVERLYQNHRLLLRLRLIPGKYGEEATLQVLRGAALRFYKQQQLVSMEQEAMGFAHQLQNKINELYVHSHSQSILLPENLNTLPELMRSLKSMEYQLHELQSLKFDESADEE